MTDVWDNNSVSEVDSGRAHAINGTRRWVAETRSRYTGFARLPQHRCCLPENTSPPVPIVSSCTVPNYAAIVCVVLLTVRSSKESSWLLATRRCRQHNGP